MADTDIKAREFSGLDLNHYKREFKKDLRILGSNQNKLYKYLFVRDYYFGGLKSDILLFIDIEKDKDWQEHVPFVKAIAIGDKVVDGKTIDKRYAKYISNSIYGQCKVATVADFDRDGNDDYAIAIVTAFGRRGATKNKAVELLGESKSLFEGENVHIMLAKEFKEMLRKSREMEQAEE
jgi:hypothetical protein